MKSENIVLEPKARGWRIHGRRETFATRRAAARWLEKTLWRGCTVRVYDAGSHLYARYDRADPWTTYAVKLLLPRSHVKNALFGLAYSMSGRRLAARLPYLSGVDIRRIRRKMTA